MRRRFARFKLGAHFLDLRCLLLELRGENVNLFLLFLVLAVLFEELVEQHGVHGVVAHCVGLSIRIACDQSRVDLFHIFRDEAKLRDALGIELSLVTESHWFEGKDCFACLVHRLNLILEPGRGGAGAKLAV